MSHNPPPAPDWTMGDDGHWKPPPIDGPASDIPSLDVYFPEADSPEGEKIGTLFEVDDEVYAVITPGTERPELLTLVAGVRALVE